MICNKSLRIYCRLRASETKESNNDQRNKIVRLNEKIISLRNEHLEEQFEFEQVFDEDCCQMTMFKQIGQPLIESLFNGNDILLFAYGVTSSGKTYTLNGTPQHPGLILRSLAYIFEVITQANINRKGQITYDNQNGFIFNKQTDFVDDIEDQNDGDDTFFGDCINSNNAVAKKFKKTISAWSSITMHFDEDLFSRIKIEKRRFSLFVSFVEIYNNYIYDLLEFINPQSRQTSRQLVYDSNKMVYVQCRHFEVKNLIEAFRVYLYGLQNRRMDKTEMNDNSSRSHSIFTIKLVYYDQTDDEDFIPNLQVNQFSIVDLAGVERTNRTKNTGTKLCEASHINNSLMSLRLCLDAMRKNQMNSNKKNFKPLLIPYRQSKLTHFLKRFFEFSSIINMIVCIKTDVADFDQNQQVLSFGQKTQKIVIENLQRNHVQDKLNTLNCSNNEVDGFVFSKFNRFDPETYKQMPLSKASKEIEKYLNDYHSIINELFSNVEKILAKLDIHLKDLPEKQIDRKSLIIDEHRICFMDVCRKLLHLLDNKQDGQNQSSYNRMLDQDHGMVLQQKHHPHNIHLGYYQQKKILIQELHRQLQSWQNENIELENKFSSLIAVLDRYVDRSFSVVGSVNKLRLKKPQMDVFNRLYYDQSTIQRKRWQTHQLQNQSLNRSIMNRSPQQQTCSTRNKLLQNRCLSSTRLLASSSRLNKNNLQLYQSSSTSSSSSLSNNNNNNNFIIDKNKKTQPQTTTIGRLFPRRPLSEKMENICRKFEPTMFPKKNVVEATRSTPVKMANITDRSATKWCHLKCRPYSVQRKSYHQQMMSNNQMKTISMMSKRKGQDLTKDTIKRKLF